MPASSRRYPWVAFSPDREVGKDILFVTDVSKTIDGVKVLDKVSFIVNHGDKIAFVGDNENAHTAPVSYTHLPCARSAKSLSARAKLW